MTQQKLSLDSLQTPCLIADRSKMRANISRLQNRLSGSPALMRPHLKTLKSYEAALLVMDSPKGPAAVSTMKEAEIFGEHGVTDLLYAVCISPQKLDRVTALRSKGIDLKIVTDSVAGAQHIAAHAKATNDPIPVLIEVDADGHRSGVAPSEPELLVQIGKTLHEGGAKLEGVMVHAGESYGLSNLPDREKAAREESSSACQMAEVLQAAGLPCPTVSIGSTPTGFTSVNLEGVTELRAGVFVFFDLFQAGIGVCDIDEIALSVLTTVIGHQPGKNWIITDAGWMAMSRDRGTEGQAVDQYYGVVCDINGVQIPDLVVLKTNQEHGTIAVRPGSNGTLPDLPIGTQLRILPNHACPTAAAYDQYYVVDGSCFVETIWPRFNGW